MAIGVTRDGGEFVTFMSVNLAYDYVLRVCSFSKHLNGTPIATEEKHIYPYEPIRPLQRHSTVSARHVHHPQKNNVCQGCDCDAGNCENDSFQSFVVSECTANGLVAHTSYYISARGKRDKIKGYHFSMLYSIL